MPLAAPDFATGSLPVSSFVRPAELFTAHRTLVHVTVGTLRPDVRRRVVAMVVQVIQRGGRIAPS